MLPSEQYDYAGAIANQPLGGKEIRFPTRGFTDATESTHFATPLTPAAVNVLARLPYNPDFCGGTRPGLGKLFEESFASPRAVFSIPWKEFSGAMHVSIVVVDVEGVFHVVDGTAVDKDIYAETDDESAYIVTDDGMKIIFSGVSTVVVDGEVTAGCVLGETFYYLSGNSMCIYTPRTGAAGVVLEDAFGATSIRAWRGRIVLFGADNIVRFSSVTDPTNFDMGGDFENLDRASCVSFAEAGQIGNKITAFIPFSNNIALVGTRNELWCISEDAVKGKVSRISREYGIISDSAWGLGDGEVMFLSEDGPCYWRIDTSVTPLEGPSEDGTRKAVYGLRRPDQSKKWLVGYDRELGGHLILAVTDGIAVDESWFVCDDRSVWPFRFSASAKPVSICRKRDGEVSKLILACADGFVRAFTRSSSNDDSDEFSGAITVGPVTHTTGATENAFLAELVCEMDLADTDASGAFVSGIVGRTAHEVCEKARAFVAWVNGGCVGDAPGETFRYQVGAGWNRVRRPRVRCNSFAAVIWSVGKRWAYSKLTVAHRGCGRIRQ